MFLELGYINVSLDKKVWGSNDEGTTRKVNTTDAIKAALLFRYTF